MRAKAFGGAPDGERLERQTRLVDLGEIGDRELRHASPAMGNVLDQACCVKAPEGLADRHRAHPQRDPQLLDRQPLAGRQMPRDDRIVQRRERPVGERPVSVDDPRAGELGQSGGHCLAPAGGRTQPGAGREHRFDLLGEQRSQPTLEQRAQHAADLHGGAPAGNGLLAVGREVQVDRQL